jgi:UDP-2,3-diacylglucosamine hydrolase
MRGNRDFLMGEQFEAMTGCRLLPDPWHIDLNGTKTLLSHGDELCTDDVEYVKFRKQVRQPAWQQAFLDKSVEQRLAFAQEAREQSRAHTGQTAMEIMDVNQSAVEQCLLQHDVTQLIHGHTHRPQIHHFTFNDTPMTRIVLGDWYEHGSVLECTPSGCRLQNLSLRHPPL